MSRALRAEGARSGVRQSTLCPGVIRTPILTGGRFGRMAQPMDPGRALEMWEQLRPMEPDEFARRALNLVAENRGIIIVPGWWRLICWLNGTASRLFEHTVALGLKRMMEQVLKPGAPPSRRSAEGTHDTRARAGS